MGGGRAGAFPEPRPRSGGRREVRRRRWEPFRRLVELRPGWAEGYVDLGTALYNAGETSEAVAVFTRRWSLTRDPSGLLESLGTALWRQGREAEAAEHFRRAAAPRIGGPAKSGSRGAPARARTLPAVPDTLPARRESSASHSRPE